MPDTAKPKNDKKSLFITLAILIAAAVYLGSDLERLWNIILMLLGFGGVIFVHELGHFIAAKSVGILVEGFSLGFGPILLAIKGTQTGRRIRILPGIIGSSDGNGLSFTLGRGSAKDADTEYCLRLVPLGGFVKMLGQEDIAADKPSDNPRAYGNKPVWQRMIVIVAGVAMNVISAIIVFMLVFSKGVQLPPAVVGAVEENLPAARAGLRGGDEILALDGKENISFTDVAIAGAFVNEGEKVAFKVKHPDGSIETIHVAPILPESGMFKDKKIKIFGIIPPSTLTVAQIDTDQPESLEELAQAGFQPGDTIVAAQGQPISRYDQLAQVLFPQRGVKVPDTITLTIRRTDPDGSTTDHTVDVPMRLAPAGTDDTAATVLGMVPRLKITGLVPDGSAQQAGAREGDIIIRLGSLDTPTSQEMQQYCKNNAGQEIELEVLRPENGTLVPKIIHVTPRRDNISRLQQLLGNESPARIGILMNSDLDSPIVAMCQKYRDIELPLPRGAQITDVGNTPVNTWGDVIDRLAEKSGQSTTLTYRSDRESAPQTVAISVPADNDGIGFAYRPDSPALLALPLKPLTRLFQAPNWYQSLRMGLDMTSTQIAQTYLMIKGMLTRTVSPKAASGPVGILRLSYRIVEEKSLTYYCYFMAIISVCIAVFNILPLPVLDGGHLVFLLIEKIKGSPVSIKIQEFVTYAGLILIVGLFLFISYNDIASWFKGQF